MFQDRTFEKPRVGEADKGEHLEAAVKGTAHARAGECVCPSVFWVSVCPLQRLCDKTACHDNDRHPDGEVSLRGEVDPKGVFNDPVGEGVKDFAELRGLVAFAGDGAVNSIEDKDKSKDCEEVEVKFSVSAEQGNHNKG